MPALDMNSDKLRRDASSTPLPNRKNSSAMGLSRLCKSSRAVLLSVSFRRRELWVSGRDFCCEERLVSIGPAMELSYLVVETPMGPFTVGASEAAIHEAFFGEPAARRTVISPVKHSALAMAKEQVEQYFAGERRTFSLPIAQQGTPFQRRAWAALQNIPFGTTICYSEMSDLMGEPGKARAVGMANNRNRVGLIVPCHRVVGKNGTLTGYRGGLDLKKSLLEFEAQVSVGAKNSSEADNL